PGESLCPAELQGETSWRGPSSHGLARDDAAPRPLPPLDSLTRAGRGPSSPAVLAGRGACGGSLPRCHSGACDTARGAAGGRGGPALGLHTRRWRPRHRAGRRTTGRAPAARGRPRPQLLSLEPVHRTGFAAAPVDSNALRQSAPLPARPVDHYTPPPPAA